VTAPSAPPQLAVSRRCPAPPTPILDPPPPPSLPLLHRRRRQWPRFTRMAPPQRSSAPSCIPAFDELSLHPLAGNGSRVVGLGSS
jgi:hypothetical protein